MARRQKLYMLCATINERSYVFGRSPSDILEAVECCREDLTEEDLANVNLPRWMREGATVDDIVQIKEGEILFQQGWINLGEEDPFEKIALTSDFSLRINPESAAAFETARNDMANLVYGKLHYLVCRSYAYAAGYFVPKDVAENMMKIDLEPLKRFGEMRLLEAAGLQMPHIEPAKLYNPAKQQLADHRNIVDEARRRSIS